MLLPFLRRVAIERERRELLIDVVQGRHQHIGTRMHDSEHVRAADFDGDGNQDMVFVAESDESTSARLPAGSQGNALAAGDVDGRRPDRRRRRQRGQAVRLRRS